jgi:hypothetical protein
VTASGLNPSISTRLGISAENTAAWGSFPMRTFVAISQAEAALTNTSVENDSISVLALTDNRLGSASAHRRAWVSMRTGN